MSNIDDLLSDLNEILEENKSTNLNSLKNTNESKRDKNE